MRRDEPKLKRAPGDGKAELDRVIVEQRDEIDAILRAFDVPTL